MRLTFNCSSCKEENTLKTKFNDRGLLQESLGDEVAVNCNKCGKTDKKHINRITAVPDRRIIYAAIVIAIVLGLFLWFFIGLVSSAVVLLPFSVWLYENNAASTFNKYKIRRK